MTPRITDSFIKESTERYTDDGVYIGREGETDAFELCKLTSDKPPIES